MTNQDHKSHSNKVTSLTCVRPSKSIKAILTPISMFMNPAKPPLSVLIQNSSRILQKKIRLATTQKSGRRSLQEFSF